MKKELGEESGIHLAAPSTVTQKPNQKSPYHQPRVEPAGSIFQQTQALGGGSKDGLGGSALL